MHQSLKTCLEQCIENFGEAPRTHKLWDRMTYLNVFKPMWLLGDDHHALHQLFARMEELLKHGVVVWGHVVQANALLFEKGRDNCPGEVVFSLEEPLGVDPAVLSQVAEDLFSMKGTRQPDPTFAQIADRLTNEYESAFGHPVPTLINSGLACRTSSTLFFRKHLPGKYLQASLLPMIVLPYKPFLALPLPERYWPRALVEWWTAH